MAKANKQGGVPKYVVAQLNEHVTQIMAELDEKPNTGPSPEPTAQMPNSIPNPEDREKLLNWALLHGDQKLTCTVMKSCTCATNRSLACPTCAEIKRGHHPSW